MSPPTRAYSIVLHLLLVVPAVYATHHSVPEDIAAFPKYAVRFLNGLPIDNDTAHSWLSTGLQGGLRQFLGETAPSIGSGQQSEDLQFNDNTEKNTYYDTLQFMRMGQNKAFLCHIPPPPPPPPPFADNDQGEVPATKSWQLLSALAGTCLYHRQGWFTYSYCHNLHVRQFRELANTQPTVGIQAPEEDNQWESFTLGRSPTADLSQDLVATEETALAQNLEVARGARERYLVQRWGDGTICDKTGRHREIEVQFHCSISSMDSIILVKETSTCKYVLVIHTPRLCGEPGFKSRAEHTEEAVIRCREIMDNPSQIERSSDESMHPRRQYTKLNTLASGPLAKDGSKEKQAAADKLLDFSKDEKAQNILSKFLEKMLSGSKDADLSVSVDEDEDGRQYFVVEGDEDLLAKLAQPPAPSKDEPEEPKTEEGSSKKPSDDTAKHVHYDL